MGDLNRRTTFANAIREVQRLVEGNNFDNLSAARLDVAKATLKRNFDSFMEVHDRLIGAQMPPADFDAHERVRAEINGIVDDIEARIIERVQLLERNNAQQQQPQQQQQANLGVAPDMRYLLTQKMENTYGEFDGTIEKWATFRDMFKSAVHDADHISNAYKFQLLKKSLKEEAAEVVEDWQITDDNYAMAWERLNEMFDHPHLAATHLIEKLNELPVLTKATRKGLQHLSNVANNVKRQLVGMGYNMDQGDILYLGILEKKLDYATKRQWEKERPQQNPTLKIFFGICRERSSSITCD